MGYLLGIDQDRLAGYPGTDLRRTAVYIGVPLFAAVGIFIQAKDVLAQDFQRHIVAAACARSPAVYNHPRGNIPYAVLFTSRNC